MMNGNNEEATARRKIVKEKILVLHLKKPNL